MKHKLPNLGYEYSALEPYIDAETMKIHHTKHHQAYIDNLNKALETHTDLQEKPVEELLLNTETIPEDIKIAVKNNAGGHLNHSFFWTILKKDTQPSGEILEAINSELGGVEEFQKQFKQAALTQFGGGWAWLVVNNQGKLEIVKTKDHETPITNNKTPILVIDVWEHAYYLKYQNRRADYADAFFNVINWDQVNKYYLNSLKK
ncbi:superoxide dismutase [Nanoarchaeota archaeon]